MEGTYRVARMIASQLLMQLYCYLFVASAAVILII
jgi:hypothetical protein